MRETVPYNQRQESYDASRFTEANKIRKGQYFRILIHVWWKIGESKSPLRGSEGGRRHSREGHEDGHGKTIPFFGAQPSCHDSFGYKRCPIRFVEIFS